MQCFGSVLVRLTEPLGSAEPPNLTERKPLSSAEPKRFGLQLEMRHFEQFSNIMRTRNETWTICSLAKMCTEPPPHICLMRHFWTFEYTVEDGQQNILQNCIVGKSSALSLKSPRHQQQQF